ncbi:MAG: CpsD/CapB family tyrosine-protein kinase [Clostridia bacterium]|nr:CpsD/CapB family tyrosine-protein kinase [Clostridia bacterium]
MEEIKLRMVGSDNYSVQEALKVLRTNLQFCGQNIRVIVLTSCDENEGKTTISLHIAKSFAELGKKVLFIDADMRKSVLAGRNTNARDVLGLSEVLSGQRSLTDCIYKTDITGLHVLLAGKYPPNPVELLNGKVFAMLLSEARKVYDYVIIDSPPLGRVIDAAVIASRCDGAALVIGGNDVRRKQAKEVVEQLRKCDCHLLGVIRNNTVAPKGRYMYKKRSSYKYSYSSSVKSSK